eukprot:GHVN01024735.1.p1 GENE.GHVN01024735.1~~GHVN01024735.1.p1  ORF type:complete len:368 (-),score=67.49 GHVN01024735.1:392-1495(-)
MANIAYSIDDVHTELHPIFKQLDSLHNELTSFSGDTTQLKHLQGKVNEIDNARIQGAFISSNDKIFYGQAVLHMMLHSCYTLLSSKEEAMAATDESVHPSLMYIKKDLEGINAGLEKCRQDRTLLPRYQGMLDAIDMERVRGVFVPFDDTEVKGDPLPGQGALTDLLNEGYSKVYQILTKEEALLNDRDVAVELRHTQKVLHALVTEIETYHGDTAGLRRIQGRVNAVEARKIDGVWMKEEGKEAPAGQGTLTDLLNQCYEKLHAKIEKFEEVDTGIHPSLKHIKKDLDSILRDLHVFGATMDLSTLQRLQGRLNNIDAARVQGIFVEPNTLPPATGAPTALPGQGALHDTLNDAYSVVASIQQRLA